MDSRSRLPIEDIFEWDIVNWAPAIDFWECELGGDLNDAKAREVGARNGGLSLWLALRGAEVICSDIKGPTDGAREKHSRYGVADRVTYQSVDALHIPYENQFDIVAFKSMLGGIRGRHGDEAHIRVINQIYKSLKPGGCVVFAENLEASYLHRLMRERYVNWSSGWKYLNIEEVGGIFRGFSRFSFKTSGFLGALGRNQWQRRLLGYLDGYFLIGPRHQRGIMF